MTQENHIVYFSLGVTLNDIPTDSIPHSYDGGTIQREFIDYEVSAGKLTVAASRMPGYGCTECGTKFYEPNLYMRALVKSARIFSRHGDRGEARRLIEEAREIKRGSL